MSEMIPKSGSLPPSGAWWIFSGYSLCPCIMHIILYNAEKRVCSHYCILIKLNGITGTETFMTTSHKGHQRVKQVSFTGFSWKGLGTVNGLHRGNCSC